MVQTATLVVSFDDKICGKLLNKFRLGRSVISLSWPYHVDQAPEAGKDADGTVRKPVHPSGVTTGNAQVRGMPGSAESAPPESASLHWAGGVLCV